MARIAVIQTAFPGDVILSTPVFEALKAARPDCSTTAVVRLESACLLGNNPYIDRVVVYDKYGPDRGLKGIFRIAARLRGFDTALVVQRHLRSAMIPWVAGIPERIGYRNSSGQIFLTRAVQYNPQIHEVARCLDLVPGLGDRSQFKPRIYIDEELSSRIDNLMREGGIRYDFAAVAPGSVWPTKRYPEFAKLIDLIYDRLDMPVIILGGPSDRAQIDMILGSVAHPPLDLCGRTDLRQSAAVISKARIVFCNDSAPAHIAAAVGTPVVAIFGPTVRAFGFAPYSENSIVVENNNLDCRPCSRHGSRKCPRGHFKCMKDVTPERILEAGRSLLSGRFQDRLH